MMKRKKSIAAALALATAIVFLPVRAEESSETADQTATQSSPVGTADDTKTYMGITMEGQEEMAEEEGAEDQDTAALTGFESLFAVMADSSSTNSPRNSDSTVYDGIDVSYYQGSINWSSVASDGISYAIVKIGGRGYGSAGNLYSDPYYETNLTNAQAAGLEVGAYYFSQATSAEEAVEEADAACELLEGYDLDLPLFMDYEWESGYRADNDASVSERTAIVKAFCEEVLANGREVGIYSGAYLAGTKFDGASLASMYYMWIATYGSKVSSYYTGVYDSWQYSSTGSVSGTSGNVDMDYWYNSDGTMMLRVYNPNSGEHFFTSDIDECLNLTSLGWNYEGIAWTLPTEGDPVYRLYNANGGEHLYTLSSSERDTLVSKGWIYEGISWYSSSGKETPLYRVYNPNAYANNHHYTASKTESDYLVSLGWKYEGIAWYGA